MDKVLSPGIGRPLLWSTTVSGPGVVVMGEAALEGEALRLPLKVAVMVCISVKVKCWFRFFSSSLNGHSKSSLLCLWGRQHQECNEQPGTVHV